MYDCLITFRSVMPAQRAEGVLHSERIGCAVRRTPKWMESQGCGYSLRVGSHALTQAARLLQRHRIPYRKLYRQTETGALEEMHI